MSHRYISFVVRHRIHNLRITSRRARREEKLTTHSQSQSRHPAKRPFVPFSPRHPTTSRSAKTVTRLCIRSAVHSDNRRLTNDQHRTLATDPIAWSRRYLPGWTGSEHSSRRRSRPTGIGSPHHLPACCCRHRRCWSRRCCSRSASARSRRRMDACGCWAAWRALHVSPGPLLPRAA